MTIWTWQNWRWTREEVGFGRRIDAVVTCYGPLWKIDIKNRTLAVDILLAGLGITLDKENES